MRLKFISLNTWFGGKLWEPMVEFLKAESPDILALQEVHDTPAPTVEAKSLKTLDNLSPKLSMPYRMFIPAYSRIDDIGKTRVDTGNAVLSKMTIIETESWYLPGMSYGHYGARGETDATTHPRVLQHVVININGKKLHIFNIHGLWGTHGADTPERLAMSQFILEKIGNTQPAILCGDFNTNADTRSIGMLGEKLVDVFDPDQRITSFNMKHKPADSGYKDAVVDFIFTTKDIKVISHATPPVDVSDHMPLVMEFEI